MSRLNTYVLFSVLLSISFLYSCQKDNYEDPQIKPKIYSYNIPDRVSFIFSQISENRESLTPYTNTLSIKNTSNNQLSGAYVVFAFDNSILDFDNLTFLNHETFDAIATNETSEVLTLENSNELFNDENLIASILNFNSPSSDHNLSGLYTGELNVFESNEIEDVFLRSVNCTGYIDYTGQFNFFIHNQDENNIVRLKGNFNSENLITGSILDRNFSDISSMTNIIDEIVQLNDTFLTGSVKFTENITDERILKFNLTKED